MNSAEFRRELIKIMPGYAWTVHKSSNPAGHQSATGTQSSGFNRLSTLKVTRRVRDGSVDYETKSAGNGTKARWAHISHSGTLARSLRGLQSHYEREAAELHCLASRLKSGRTAADNTAT